MGDGARQGVCETGPIELDVRRMDLPADLEAQHGAALDAAIAQMEAVERGEAVNVDEGRRVGHYWLRNPGAAPTVEDREAITTALEQIECFGDETFKGRFDKILWIGIGGSASGPQLLYDALRGPHSRAMFFFDNTDPVGMHRTLGDIERAGGLDKTLTVVVSKSGGTRETVNGMIVAQRAYAEIGASFADHAVAITQPGSKLDTLAEPPEANGQGWLARFPVWDWVGGRTSLFSAVGLLPARLLDFDGAGLCEGAKRMDDATRDRDLAANPALMLAAAWFHSVETTGLRNMVVLPYCDRLASLSAYLQQLIMESLGKDGKGITVYGHKGSTDQHSYVQQLRDGYNDFFVTFIRVRHPQTDWEVEPGVTVGDYLLAFQEGTAEALSNAGRRSMRITLDQMNAHGLGGLIALFERAVGYYAAMVGINAYDQPGVEAGKKAAEAIIRRQRERLQ